MRSSNINKLKSKEIGRQIFCQWEEVQEIETEKEGKKRIDVFTYMYQLITVSIIIKYYRHVLIKIKIKDKQNTKKVLFQHFQKYLNVFPFNSSQFCLFVCLWQYWELNPRITELCPRLFFVFFILSGLSLDSDSPASASSEQLGLQACTTMHS